MKSRLCQWEKALGLASIATVLGLLSVLLVLSQQPHGWQQRKRLTSSTWLGSDESAGKKLAWQTRSAAPAPAPQSPPPQGCEPVWRSWLHTQPKESLQSRSVRAAAGADMCSAELGFPKVALLFLTRGVMHHERVWALWFRAAEGLLPLRAFQSLSCSPARLELVRGACRPPEGRGPQGAGPIQRQHLASVYLHVGSNENFTGFPDTSIFHGLDIADRIAVEWGTFTLVDATKALMRAALVDPANQKFMLMSESDAPLYPLGALWRQLMWEEKSRVNSCAPTDRGGEARLNSHRWTPAIHWNGGPSWLQWRKSWQWVTLKRSHVEIALADTRVADAFRVFCRGLWLPDLNIYGDCWPDEHYFPTLLSMGGLDDETDCLGITMHIMWRRPTDTHPASWTEDEITPEIFREWQRTEPDCDPRAAYAAAALELIHLDNVNETTCATAPVGGDGPQGSCNGTLGYHCSLAVRKFAPGVAQLLFDTLTDCHADLGIVSSERVCSM